MPRNVLVLCTGNSARSILGEVLFSDRTDGRWRGHSAGSTPKDRPHPDVLSLLAARGHETARLRSKSWDEFAAPDAPRMDLVVTVCDSAAAEECPWFPGAGARAHWSLPDPAHVEPAEARAAAFVATYEALAVRIDALMVLPPDASAEEIQAAAAKIGEMA